MTPKKRLRLAVLKKVIRLRQRDSLDKSVILKAYS